MEVNVVLRLEHPSCGTLRLNGNVTILQQGCPPIVELYGEDVVRDLSRKVRFRQRARCSEI